MFNCILTNLRFCYVLQGFQQSYFPYIILLFEVIPTISYFRLKTPTISYFFSNVTFYVRNLVVVSSMFSTWIMPIV